MGYVTNYYPPERWFYGKTFLEKTKEVLDEIKEKKDEIIKAEISTMKEEEFTSKIDSTVSNLVAKTKLAYLNVIRGIRAAILLPVGDGFDIEELEGKISKYNISKLTNALETKFSVTCSGGSMYGYPNVDFENNITGEYFRASESDGFSLMVKAVEERERKIEKLLKIAIDILWEIYSEEKKDELFYYCYADLYGDDLYEMCDPLIEEGIARTVEEIVERYGDDPYELYDRFKAIFDKHHTESLRWYHNEMIWDWQEEDRIYQYGY